MYNCLQKIKAHFSPKLLAVLTIFMMICGSAWAATYYWVGGTPGSEYDWDTYTNWNTNADGSGTSPNPSFSVDGDGKPQDTVIIPSGKAVIMDSYADGRKVKKIEIQSGARLFIYCSADFYETTTLINNGTLIIPNLETNDSIRFTFSTPKDCNLGNFLFSGNTTIIINGNCEATTFQLAQDSNLNNVAEDFDAVITGGTGSDRLHITSTDSDAFNITRCTSDSGANGNGTLTIDVNITCEGGIKTNDKTNVTINENKTVSAETITGVEGSITNNGKLEITNATNSNLDTIDSTGSGNIEVAGEPIYIWTGSTSSAWNEAANWQSGVPPDDAENIIIRNVASPAYLPEISSSVSVKEISFETGAKLKVTGDTGSFTLNDNTSNFDISNIDPDSTGTVKTTGKFTVSTEAYTASALKIECNTIDVTAALTANKLTIKDTTEFKANVTLDSFIASNLGGKTITLTNSDLTASNVTLTGSTGSLLSLKGPGTIKSVGTSYTSFSAEYLSIDNTIELKNYSNAIAF